MRHSKYTHMHIECLIAILYLCRGAMCRKLCTTAKCIWQEKWRMEPDTGVNYVVQLKRYKSSRSFSTRTLNAGNTIHWESGYSIVSVRLKPIWFHSTRFDVLASTWMDLRIYTSACIHNRVCVCVCVCRKQPISRDYQFYSYQNGNFITQKLYKSHL